MKKILVIMLLTFTTMAYANGNDDRFLMVADTEGYVWVLDSKNVTIKRCFATYDDPKDERYVKCTKWEDLW